MGIFDVFSNKNANNAATAQVNALGSANDKGQAFLSNGINDAKTSYATGLAPFQQTFKAAQGGEQAYGDATGANGPEGFARAVSQFQTSPGYNYTRDQATENELRNMGRTGQTGQGNIDLATVGSNLANQQWQSYIQNLLPFMGQATTSAGGLATGGMNLGNLENTNATTSGNMVYGSQAGMGNAIASADLANNNASANGVSALMQGGTAIAKAAPSFMSALAPLLAA